MLTIEMLPVNRIILRRSVVHKNIQHDKGKVHEFSLWYLWLVFPEGNLSGFIEIETRWGLSDI